MIYTGLFRLVTGKHRPNYRFHRFKMIEFLYPMTLFYFQNLS